MIHRRGLQSVVLMASLIWAVHTAVAQQPAEYFGQSCASCHTIGGGRLIGPDLKDVAQRKDRAWLEKFVQNPKAVIDSGDGYATQLLNDSQGIVMPTLPGLDAARAQALLDLIDVESKLPRSQFAGTQVSERPFTPQDVSAGREIFLGTKALKNGAPACVSCHTLKGLGGLSGGRLGPDLTLVFERLQGRKGLTAWLGNPASPIMMPVFKPRALDANTEILPLVALFEDAARNGGRDDSTARLNFLLLGMGGMVLGLVTLDAVWKKRLRGVRRALVNSARSQSETDSHSARGEQ